MRGGRYIIGRSEKGPEKVGRREKSGRKCREEGENEMLGVGRSPFCLRPKICWPAKTPKHPAAPEKNPLVTRVRFNTTLSQYRLVFYSGHSDVSKSNGHLCSHGCSKVPRGVWGYSREFLVGVSRQVLKILTLFHTKKMLFPTPVSDPSLKSIPIFRPGIESRLELKRDFLKSISNSLITLSS